MTNTTKGNVSEVKFQKVLIGRRMSLPKRFKRGEFLIVEDDGKTLTVKKGRLVAK